MSNAEAKIMNPEKAPITATVTRNLEHNGLEITFSGVPSAKIRTSLKSNGFHWHNGKQIWYAKYNDKHVDFIKSMKWELPESEEEPEEVAEVEEPEVEPDNAIDLATALSRIAELEAELASYKKTFAKVPQSKKTEDAILKRVLSDKSPNLQKAHKFSGGYGFTDSHYLLTDKDSHGIEEAENPLDVNLLLSGMAGAKKAIPVDIAELKKFVKEHASKKDKTPYVIQKGDLKVGVNPRFLLDCLTWCNVSEFYINADLVVKGNCYKNPLFFKNDRKALCLPVNVK